MNHKLENIMASVLGVALVSVALGLFFVFTLPTHVLKDWHIKTTDTAYHPNETIEITSSSIKLRNATGQVSRTIECNSGNDSVIGYNLNLSKGSRPAGSHTSTYEVKLPSNITNLPATCRVVIAVDYKLYGFRHIIENTVSNNFTVMVQ